MRLALNDAKAVFEDVRILWRVGDEALFGQAGGEPVVIVGVQVRIGRFAGASFEPMLAYHDGTALAWLEVLRDQKNAVSEDSGRHIQHNFIATEFRMVVDLARTGIGGQSGRGKASDHFAPDVVAIEARALLPTLRR